MRVISTRSAVMLGALAGGLGWGIRGCFGGEAGAMVPGALFGLCIARLVPRARPELFAAIGALAFSIGGSMTYGQTLGLVHNVPNSPTLAWGILGLALKGGVWIGLGALLVGLFCLGEPMPGRRMVALLGGALVLFIVGKLFINGPFDPPHRLPLTYFSDAMSDKPRAECWGGLWLAYLGLLVWARGAGVRPAWTLSLCGLAGGAIGFPLGEALQAWGHLGRPLGDFGARWVDWWKVMEMIFGATAGAAIAYGATRIRSTPTHPRPPKGRTQLWELWALLAWCMLFILVDIEWLPLGALLYLPFLAVAFPAWACASAGAAHRERSALLIGAAFVLAVSAANVGAKAFEEGMPGAWLVALAALAVTAAVAYRVLRHDPTELVGAEGWIIFVAVTQTALTIAKSLMTGPAWSAGGHALFGGSAITVELVFIALCVALVVLLRPST